MSLAPTHDFPLGIEDTAGDDAPSERERLMAEFTIRYNGRHYEYGAYRYDHLDDAVNQARLQRARPSFSNWDRSERASAYVQHPDEAQRALMATLAITFQDGTYRMGGFRYDRLADAVAYAHLRKEPMR